MWWFFLGCHPSMDPSPSSCGECHAALTSAWTTSFHAQARTSPAFEEAFRRADDPWCLTCHREPDGVDCAACHAERKECVDCHQFDLPGTSVASQDTAREHAASSFANQPCTSCHDPHAASHGSHDEVALRRALSVEVLRTVDGSVATFETQDVGHAYPTGDPFRRLVLEICGDLACSRVLERHTLERRLVEVDGTWSVRSDTRIPPPTNGPVAQHRLDVVTGRAWRLWYRRVDPRHTTLAHDQVLVDAGLVRSSP